MPYFIEAMDTSQFHWHCSPSLISEGDICRTSQVKRYKTSCFRIICSTPHRCLAGLRFCRFPVENWAITPGYAAEKFTHSRSMDFSGHLFIGKMTSALPETRIKIPYSGPQIYSLWLIMLEHTTPSEIHLCVVAVNNDGQLGLRDNICLLLNAALFAGRRCWSSCLTDLAKTVLKSASRDVPMSILSTIISLYRLAVFDLSMVLRIEILFFWRYDKIFPRHKFHVCFFVSSFVWKPYGRRDKVDWPLWRAGVLSFCHDRFQKHCNQEIFRKNFAVLKVLILFASFVGIEFFKVQFIVSMLLWLKLLLGHFRLSLIYARH